MTPIPWLSHLALFSTNTTLTHVIGGSVGIAFRAFAVGPSAIIANPFGIAPFGVPFDSVKVVPILRAIYFSGSIPLSVGSASH